MNELYNEQQLPTDFVYTAKMMYGVMDLIEKDFFLPGSKIVVYIPAACREIYLYQKTL